METYIDSNQPQLVTSAGDSRQPLVSVLIPCCGQLEFTRLCVPSLLRHSRPPVELIFLDVGSVDGTAEYLAGVAAAAALRVEVVRSVTDLDIPAACEDALRRAGGDYLVLLNNDTIVSDRWLQQLVGLAQLAPGIGLVGPMSNHAAPPQLVESAAYRAGPRRKPRADDGDLSASAAIDIAPVEEFARRWHDEQRGKWLEVDHLGGFCLLIKRPILEHIGPLNAKSGLNIFDTDALCQKARQAGYTLACCKDLFIHHFGSRTYAHAGPAP